ncbi:890_t:CDS:10 [Entrophospora sp. SA101]|nr:890_t:CDS:10 [Entrophospora sp. SA101]
MKQRKQKAQAKHEPTDYKKYRKTLFEILLFGGVLAPGGTIFYAEDNIENIKKHVKVFNNLIRHYLYLQHIFEGKIKNMLQYINKWGAEESNKLATAIGLFASGKLISISILNALFAFKAYLGEQNMEHLGSSLKKAGIDSKLIDFFPANKKDKEYFARYFKADYMKQLVDFYNQRLKEFNENYAGLHNKNYGCKLYPMHNLKYKAHFPLLVLVSDMDGTSPMENINNGDNDVEKIHNCSTVKKLLSDGADPNVQNENGETPLHIAAKNEYLRIKANTEIKENLYGQTPLFLAVIEGHVEAVKLLLEAKANPNVKDDSGLTPYAYSILHGHIELKNLLHPLTTISEFEPHSSSPTSNNKASDSKQSLLEEEGQYVTKEVLVGHKYLKTQSMIIVTLGNTDIRKGVTSVQLYDKKLPSSNLFSFVSMSLVISAENATGEPSVVELSSISTDPIIFHATNPGDVILTFDIMPTYGAKKQLIGRATALLSSFVKPSSLSSPDSIHASLTCSTTIPIISTQGLDLIGEVMFEVLVVNPFKHPKMMLDKRNTFHRSFTTTVIGHRGMGANTVTPSLQLGENTLISFITAASLGAEYVEFDIQLTKDHVPVIYHDWTFSESGYDIPIHEVTLGQFLNFKKKELSSKGNDNNNKLDIDNFLIQDRKIIEEFIHPSSNTNSNNNSIGIDISGNSSSTNNAIILKKHNSTSSLDSYNNLNINTEIKFKGNSAGSIQAPFATLAETFKKVPINIGFNIEVKYPMIDESECENLSPFHTELNFFIDTILHCVYENAQQDHAGYTKMADARCNSIHEAIKFAKFFDLSGIVTLNTPILEAPELVRTIKKTGLLLFTYGKLNNNVENVKLQRKAGVDADSVLAVRNGLRKNEHE